MILLIGYGRVGRAVAKMLPYGSVKFIVVNDPAKHDDEQLVRSWQSVVGDGVAGITTVVDCGRGEGYASFLVDCIGRGIAVHTVNTAAAAKVMRKVSRRNPLFRYDLCVEGIPDGNFVDLFVRRVPIRGTALASVGLSNMDRTVGETTERVKLMCAALGEPEPDLGKIRHGPETKWGDEGPLNGHTMLVLFPSSRQLSEGDHPSRPVVDIVPIDPNGMASFMTAVTETNNGDRQRPWVTTNAALIVPSLEARIARRLVSNVNYSLGSVWSVRSPSE